MSVPRVKRMKRIGRLAHARAKDWLAKNADAKNLVRRYRRYFGVDHVAAALELRALGAKISEKRLTELKRTAAEPKRSAKEKTAKKRQAEAEMLERELERCWPEWRDEPFPFPVDEF